jgi:hypothetical protein
VRVVLACIFAWATAAVADWISIFREVWVAVSAAISTEVILSTAPVSAVDFFASKVLAKPRAF